MTDELTFLRELERYIKECGPFDIGYDELLKRINHRIIELLEAATTKERAHTPILDGERAAMFCDHANEVPAQCGCDAGCYCKYHTCRLPAGRSKVETGEFDRW